MNFGACNMHRCIRNDIIAQWKTLKNIIMSRVDGDVGWNKNSNTFLIKM